MAGTGPELNLQMWKRQYSLSRILNYSLLGFSRVETHRYVHAHTHTHTHTQTHTENVDVAAVAKSLQPCPTLCDPINNSPPGSSVPGILQTILEWIAISFSDACMHAKSLQSCLTLCDPMDSSPRGSSVHRILQAGILGWVAFSFSRKCRYNPTIAI